MTMTPRKKLIEVALPLEAISDASAYDKMPGIGPHPKGVHHWWARLPLPCARAVLFASMVDDPSCDPAFADKPAEVQRQERERLFTIIRDLIQRKVHLRPEAFLKAHEEILRCCGGQVPPVSDPFCGGGSIPLEAERLGLATTASDLNPVAVLITKALIEIVPKFSDRPPINPEARTKLDHTKTWHGAHGLAEDVRYYGRWVRDEAVKRIGYLYPSAKIPRDHGGGEATVIACIWARTVKCPNPACGVDMPLIRSFSLSTRTEGNISIRPVLDKRQKLIRYEIQSRSKGAETGTVNKRGARCLLCDTPVSFPYVKAEGRSGRIGTDLLAVVTDGPRGRVYLDFKEEQERAARKAEPRGFPDTEIPEKALGFRVQPYGFTKHRDLFTPRQLQSLTTFSDLIMEVHNRVLEDSRATSSGPPAEDKPLHAGGVGPRGYADAVATLLAFALDRCADFNNAFCRWSPSNEKVMNLFGRGAIPMVWDFAEANILGNSVGGWSTCTDYVADCLEVVTAGVGKGKGEVYQLDAAAMRDMTGKLVVSTDPPYYDNIGYADLSDFFYVWLRRSVGAIHPDICSTVLVPKTAELVATSERFNGNREAAKKHFETGFRRAFTTLADYLDLRFPMTVYYAFKQQDEDEGDLSEHEHAGRAVVTTGWESMLEALTATGFQVTGTWPVRASQAWRMRAMGSNALASYIVLACRVRPKSAVLATRREFTTGLKKELPDALRKLQQGNIAPVDLAQAAIGPGMAVFSRYSKVVEADGSAMSIRTALALINQTLDEVFAEQESEFDADTRWALAWFEQYAFDEGPYGVAETLSKAKNTSVQGMVEAGIVSARAGKVRLIGRKDLAEDWDPASERRLTIWEVAHYLIRLLEDEGESAAGTLLRQVGALGETARDLAYRLFGICERKKWAQEALPYNSLVVAWPEITRLSRSERPREEQIGLGMK